MLATPLLKFTVFPTQTGEFEVTEGVGKASTTSVVLSSLLILIFDLVLVKLSLWIWPTLD